MYVVQCFVIDELLKAMARSIVFKCNYLKIFLSFVLSTCVVIKKKTPKNMSGDSITSMHQTYSGSMSYAWTR